MLFNGLQEALHIAAACAAYDTQVAVHNCYGPLATQMNAAFCAVGPELHLMERDVDEVPWAASLVTSYPQAHSGGVRVRASPAGARM